MIEAIMASICFVAFVAGVSWLGGLVVFAPLHERTLLFKIRNRYRIADIVSLAVLLQVSTGAVLALAPTDQWEPRAAVAILMLLVVTFWWVSGLRMLSRAGVENGFHRALFLIVHLPLGYLCVLGVLASVLLMPLGIDAMSQKSPWLKILGLLLVLLPAASIMWGIFSYRVCKAMAVRARDDQAKRDGIEFEQVHESQKDPAISKYVLTKQRSPQTEGVWLEESVLMATIADEDRASDREQEPMVIADDEVADEGRGEAAAQPSLSEPNANASRSAAAEVEEMKHRRSGKEGADY